MLMLASCSFIASYPARCWSYQIVVYNHRTTVGCQSESSMSLPLPFCSATGKLHDMKLDFCELCQQLYGRTSYSAVEAPTVKQPTYQTTIRQPETIDLTESPPRYSSLFIPDQAPALEERVYVTSTALTQSRRTTYPSSQSIAKAHDIASAAERERQQGFQSKKKNRPIIIDQSNAVRPSNTSDPASLASIRLSKPSLQGKLNISLTSYLIEFELNDLGIEICMEIRHLSKSGVC
jgi:hypothetical protein